MIEDGRTWVLLADGRRARVLVEPRRGAALEEQAELAIAPDELYEPADRQPRSFDRVGGHRHAIEGKFDPHEEEERRFLARVAKTIADAAQTKAFDYLVIAAPPRALGVLREALHDAVRARVQAQEAKDILNETAEQVRARLKDWRMARS